MVKVAKKSNRKAKPKPKRLRCFSCGEEAEFFECDHCGIEIDEIMRDAIFCGNDSNHFCSEQCVLRNYSEPTEIEEVNNEE